MSGQYYKAYTTMSATTNFLIKPILGNYVVLNYWSPGYSILTKDKTQDGREYEHKVFRATTSVTAAVAFLKDYYGNKEFLKFKDDAHPGHVSLLTAQNYLSIGADVARLDQIGLTTQHKIHFTQRFDRECVGFKRLPEKMLNLHSLKIEQIDEAIEEFKSSKLIYNILGGRFNFTEGESCATACYTALVAGGLDKLFRIDHELLGRHTILTPAALANYVEIAKMNELQMFPEAEKVSKKFEASRSRTLENIIKRIDKIKKQEIDAYLREKKEKDENSKQHQPKQ